MGKCENGKMQAWENEYLRISQKGIERSEARIPKHAWNHIQANGRCVYQSDTNGHKHEDGSIRRSNKGFRIWHGDRMVKPMDINMRMDQFEYHIQDLEDDTEIG